MTREEAEAIIARIVSLEIETMAYQPCPGADVLGTSGRTM